MSELPEAIDGYRVEALLGRAHLAARGDMEADLRPLRGALSAPRRGRRALHPLAPRPLAAARRPADPRYRQTGQPCDPRPDRSGTGRTGAARRRRDAVAGAHRPPPISAVPEAEKRCQTAPVVRPVTAASTGKTVLNKAPTVCARLPRLTIPPCAPHPPRPYAA